MVAKTSIKTGGSFVAAKKIYVKDAGVWQRATGVFVKEAGVWQQVYNQNVTLFDAYGVAGCFSGQAGFSVDLYQGVITLTMGAWPTDPPNCQTCDSDWLQLVGYGANGLANDSTSNIYRAANNIRPYWTNLWTLDLDAMSIGSTVQTRAPNFPYTQVDYTYSITKSTANSISILRRAAWGTGDTGTTISVANWANSFDSLAGGDGTVTPYVISWSF
jgi:hypothetical protein